MSIKEVFENTIHDLFFAILVYNTLKRKSHSEASIVLVFISYGSTGAVTVLHDAVGTRFG